MAVRNLTNRYTCTVPSRCHKRRYNNKYVFFNSCSSFHLSPTLILQLCLPQLTIHLGHRKQRPLSTLSSPMIRRPHQIYTSMYQTTPFLQEPFCNLPASRIRRLSPDNQPIGSSGSPIPEPHDIRTQLLIIPVITYPNQIIPHDRTRKQVNPSVMRTAALKLRGP